MISWAMVFPLFRPEMAPPGGYLPHQWLIACKQLARGAVLSLVNGVLPGPAADQASCQGLQLLEELLHTLPAGRGLRPEAFE